MHCFLVDEGFGHIHMSGNNLLVFFFFFFFEF
jgi:hypothetical protein